MLSYAERGRGYVDDAHFLFLLLVRSISFLESHSSVPSLSAVLALQITSNKYCALLLGLVVEAVAGRGIDAFLFSVLLVFSSLAFNTDKILRQFFPRVCPQSGGAVLGVLAFWKRLRCRFFVCRKALAGGDDGIVSPPFCGPLFFGRRQDVFAFSATASTMPLLG